MSSRRRKHWGWGWEDQQPTVEQLREAAPTIAQALGVEVCEPHAPVPLAQAQLPEPRIAAPAALAQISDAGDHARASHALGKSYCDVVDGFNGRFEHAPDAVLRPTSEAELEQVLEWCSADRVAAIPYGGGTSVVGGVTPRVGSAYNGAASIDLGALDRVAEVDDVSRSARIQAGALGPALEAQLREHGFTLRHFPQSFEYSTLGGWVATRAGGHFATLWTHIDDFVESVRAITPAGEWQSRRLPGSGAGVSPDRMLIGSEGALGVITEAWVRVQPRPDHRSSAGVRFPDLLTGAECVRELSQSGLHPSNCRLLDPGEAALTKAGDGTHALLVLGFESTGGTIEDSMRRALEICAEHGGSSSEQRSGDGGDAVSSWREAFLGAPYVRDSFVALGVLSETFETAITWERFPGFHASVRAAATEAVREVCGGGHVFCRFTHVYPNGPAPYYTVIAPARRGEEVDQWTAIKRAASEAIVAAGGTITHHHAVGRDHRPWYDRQRPDAFAAGLRAAKDALDPAGVMNPGVLVDPR
ncbi:MAG TPA: FAD-binding oxidoreductase [Solirubrobacteraceae bacterium]|nr:FAD-binding oxidoreductase [Solirubrobacteraceae bacterium]